MSTANYISKTLLNPAKGGAVKPHLTGSRIRVLILDNYDSFTFNLYQYVGEILSENGGKFTLDVVRNDEITLEEIEKRKYDRIVISPGPGDPRDPKYFGVCADVLTKIGKTTPVLGVCLGMQGMAYYFRGSVARAQKPMHGKTSIIEHDGKGVFRGLPQKLEVMRYHSLIAEKETLPECLSITATSLDTGEIMGLRHKVYPIEGIQFHPESFATEGGKQLLANFLEK
ncbi:MAG: Glutamine amidotransferase of anthranilate synthase [Candidatus Kaiserbacteria bacterium GW2011_GWA2_49_19]|uniref:Glutamine amidotransferase of anthranilate synthase n=1 Tax=Candidatus Kaiserbacteria bacterium GW2011_GWA2_49_19 TaxID=1618669 RepID=A0A0G1Y1K1_9BACT|nr:MAG: Glutamine amidotransferase of anthranilate synthase [Candidatus Kaiserbacteria bacterium GW2011_GWA2_49_19]